MVSVYALVQQRVSPETGEGHVLLPSIVGPRLLVLRSMVACTFHCEESSTVHRQSMLGRLDEWLTYFMPRMALSELSFKDHLVSMNETDLHSRTRR